MIARRRRRQGGQSMIEFALVFPILALTLFTFFDLGRAVFYYNSVSRAARAGARYAMVHSCAVTTCNDAFPAHNPSTCADAYPGSTLDDAVRYWLPGLNASDVTISCNWISL